MGLDPILSDVSEMSSVPDGAPTDDAVRRAEQILMERRRAKAKGGGQAGTDEDTQSESDAGRSGGAVDGLSSDSDFGGGGSVGDGSIDDDMEDNKGTVRRAVVEQDGEMIEIPGHAGTVWFRLPLSGPLRA